MVKLKIDLTMVDLFVKFTVEMAIDEHKEDNSAMRSCLTKNSEISGRWISQRKIGKETQEI